MDLVEAGDIAFFYRPKVEQESPEGLDDVQQFLLTLSPEHRRHHRLVVVGRKRLPDVGDHEQLWAYVELVTGKVTDLRGALAAEDYETKTRGTRHQPAARPAGEGVYALLRGEAEACLAYQLELPGDPGPVQRELNIAPQARFVLSVKNPDTGSAGGIGLSERQQADYPPALQKRFGERRWIPADPDLLDVEGAELLMVGAAEDAGEAAAALDPQHETAKTADVFTRLRLNRKDNPAAPLLEGRWD